MSDQPIKITYHGGQRLKERIVPLKGSYQTALAWAKERVQEAIEQKSFCRKPPKWAAPLWAFDVKEWRSAGVRNKPANTRYVRTFDPRTVIVVGLPTEKDKNYRIVTVLTPAMSQIQ